MPFEAEVEVSRLCVAAPAIAPGAPPDLPVRAPRGYSAEAVLVKPGYGRVGAVEGAYSYLTAAVDEDVLVQGWVETSKLGERLE